MPRKTETSPGLRFDPEEFRSLRASIARAAPELIHAPSAAGASAPPPAAAALGGQIEDGYALARQACPMLFGAPGGGSSAPPPGRPGEGQRILDVRARLALARARGRPTLAGRALGPAGLDERHDPMIPETRPITDRMSDDQPFSLAGDRRLDALTFEVDPCREPDPDEYVLPEMSIDERLFFHQFMDGLHENQQAFMQRQRDSAKGRNEHTWHERYRYEPRRADDEYVERERVSRRLYDEQRQAEDRAAADARQRYLDADARQRQLDADRSAMDLQQRIAAERDAETQRLSRQAAEAASQEANARAREDDYWRQEQLRRDAAYNAYNSSHNDPYDRY